MILSISKYILSIDFKSFFLKKGVIACKFTNFLRNEITFRHFICHKHEKWLQKVRNWSFFTTSFYV